MIKSFHQKNIILIGQHFHTNFHKFDTKFAIKKELKKIKLLIEIKRQQINKKSENIYFI